MSTKLIEALRTRIELMSVQERVSCLLDRLLPQRPYPPLTAAQIRARFYKAEKTRKIKLQLSTLLTLMRDE
jgi:hypothetical protein